MSGKLPAIQFYVGDWLRDPVAGCSLGAQGLWLRMMILMHDAENYGRLESKGRPLAVEMLARRCGCSPAEFGKYFKELEEAGVPSRSENGAIFNRRMVRDAERRETDRVRKQESRRSNTGTFRKVSGDCPADVRRMSLHASTSTSTSTSPSISGMEIPDLKTVKAKADMIGCKPEWAEEFFNHYESQGWIKANGLAITNWQISLKQWADKNREEGGTPTGKGEGGTTASKAYALDIKAKAFEEEKKQLERHRAEVAGGDFIWDDPKAKTRWFEVRKELACIAKQKQSI